MSSKTITCPKCSGKKKRWNACFPTALSGWHPCQTCDATGTISEEKQAIIEIGAEIRQTRAKKEMDTKSCADIFGCDRYQWSKIENGESTLADAYKARSIVEGINVLFTDYFDVFIHTGSDTRESFGSFTTIEAANRQAAIGKSILKAQNVAGWVEVKPRREKEINNSF